MIPSTVIINFIFLFKKIRLGEKLAIEGKTNWATQVAPLTA